jgi:hypothetical protein
MRENRARGTLSSACLSNRCMSGLHKVNVSRILACRCEGFSDHFRSRLQGSMPARAAGSVTADAATKLSSLSTRKVRLSARLLVQGAQICAQKRADPWTSNSEMLEDACRQ